MRRQCAAKLSAPKMETEGSGGQASLELSKTLNKNRKKQGDGGTSLNVDSCVVYVSPWDQSLVLFPHPKGKRKEK